VTLRREHRRGLGIAILGVLFGVVTLAGGGGKQAAAANVSYHDAVMADVPVGYWRLDEASGAAALDQTANNDRGTYTGGITLGVPGGLISDPDKAARFSGSGRIGFGNPASGIFNFGTSDFTVEAWVRTTLNTKDPIASKFAGTGAYWQIQVTNEAGFEGRVRARYSDGSAVNQAYGPPIRVDDGNWHMVDVVFARGSGVTIYVDGYTSSVTPGAVPGSVNNTGPFEVAHLEGYPYYVGDVDEVALYRSALTPPRIQTHFDAAATGDTTAPAITLTAPLTGSSVNNATLSGRAGTAAGDSQSVTVSVYSGTSATGTPLQTLNAVRQPDGTYSVAPAPALADGVYTVQARQVDQAGNVGLSTATTFTLDTAAPTVSLTSPTAGSTVMSSTPAFSGAAGAAAGDGANVAVKVYSGSGTNGSAVQTLTAVVQPDRSFSVTPAALPDGAYTAQAEQTDAAGNKGSSSAVTFSIDVNAPVVSLVAPANGSATKKTTPTLSGIGGTASGDAASFRIRLYPGTTASGTPAETLTAPRQADGSYSVAAFPALADGTYAAQADQMDAAGHDGVSNVNVFRVDTTAPTVSMVAPASGTSVSAATFRGQAGTATGDAGTVTVTVFAGAGTGGTKAETLSAAVAADGSYSIPASPALTEGTFTATASQTDDVGNVGVSSSPTFTVDTTAPVVTLTSPGYGTTLNDSTPALAGTAGTAAGDASAVSIDIFAGSSGTGIPLETVTAARVPDGTYSANAFPALLDGVYTARARQTDAAGNGGSSAAATFTVDTTPPQVTLDVPANGVVTNSPTPVFGGHAGTASGDASTVTVKVYAGTAASGTPEETLAAPVQSDGSFSILASPALADGSHTAQVTQGDVAGNGGASGATTFTVDTTAPRVRLLAPVDGSATSDQTPTFSGTAGTAADDQPTVTVRVYAGSSTSGALAETLSAPRNSDSTFRVDASPALAEGTYTAQAEQSDLAGNSALSATTTFLIHTTTSTLTLDVPIDGSALATTTPTFSGTAGTATDDSASVIVSVYSGTGTNGTLVETLAASVGSDASYAVTASPSLSEGTYTARAAQTDVAGNTAFSNTSSFVVDTTAPTVTLTAPGDGTTTSDRTPTFSGTGGTTAGDSTAIIVDVFAGSSAAGSPVESLSASRGAGGAYAIAAFPALGDGTYTARARQGDTAGNEGASGTATFTVVGTGPTVTLTSPADGSSVSNGAPTFTGTATGGGASSSVTVSVYAGPTISGAPVRTLTATVGADGTYGVAPSSPLGQGTYTAQASQSGPGGTGFSGVVTFTVDTSAPVLSLTDPLDSSATNDTTPTIAGVAGTAAGDGPTVTLRIYAGSTVGGTTVETLTASRQTGGLFGAAAFPALADGLYTVQATQSDAAGNVGLSTPRTFRVDTTAPSVTVTAPANASAPTTTEPIFAGTAGRAPGDATSVRVKLYRGSSPTGVPIQIVSTSTQNDGTWAVVSSAALVSGTYTVQADQSDAAGNNRLSNANTFMITSYRDAVMSDGPVAYWRLGEASGTRASDETGNNAGTYNGGVTLGQPGAIQGDTNTGVRLNGSTGYISVPNSPSLQTGDNLSLEIWVKRNSLGTDQRLFHKGTGSAVLHLSASNNRIRFAKSGGGDIAFSTVPVIDTTKWHHIVATKNGSNVHIYLDGVDVTGTVSQQTIVNTSNPLNIGRDLSGSWYVDGSIVDAAVYPRALTAAQVAAHYTKGVPTIPLDTTPPSVAITVPAAGASVADTTPTISGTGGNDAGDAVGVTVRIYAGTSVTGSPVATWIATRDTNGGWAIDPGQALATGTYTVQAEQDDSAGNVGLSAPRTFAVTTPAAQPAGDPVVLAAGDIADCFSDGDEPTAAIIGANPTATLLTLGDTVYPNGTPEEFTNCYDPTWGQYKSRTRPTIGDHEYRTPNAAGYFNYWADQLLPFGPAADDYTRGYYSYDLGSWHVVSLNMNCGVVGGCGTGSPEEQWLRSDLAAHTNPCTLVILHDPRFSSGSIHGSDPTIQPFWQTMYDGGVDLTLAGNDHDYERFAPQTPSGLLDLPRGITEFVVGTGGESHYSFSGGVLASNSEVRNDTTFGLLKLGLHASGYDWQFLPEAGHTFTDAGSRTCH
jgi:large repetitive protein